MSTRTQITARAATIREEARQVDGKFGEQQFHRATGVDLDGALSAVDAFDWPGGFNQHTAGPSEFDGQLEKEHVALSSARRAHHVALEQIHCDVGDRKHPGRNMVWAMTDEMALVEATRKASTVGTPGEGPGAVATAQYMQTHHDAAIRVAASRERIDALNDEYVARGAWNRAFLVANANGHVHSSMGCSTCRPSTQYAWMTDYSGADEDAIVADAGYRACTTCYPSAPIGDERTLPTKILSEGEKHAAQQRAVQQEQRTAKKVAAASNAPTASGDPIEIHYRSGKRTYVEALKTERSAQQWVTNHLIDDAENQALGDTPNCDPQKQQIEREAAQRVLDALVEKRGVDRTEVIEEVRGKALAKANRDHKASLKHLRELNLPADEDAEPRHARTLEAIKNTWT